MKICFGKLLFLSALIFTFAPPALRAADTSKDDTNFRYQTVTTKDGLTFRVPEDMPIEKRGGIQAPIPFDEYMYGKFKQMDVRLQRMEAQLNKIQELIEEDADSRARSKPLVSAS